MQDKLFLRAFHNMLFTNNGCNIINAKIGQIVGIVSKGGLIFIVTSVCRYT